MAADGLIAPLPNSLRAEHTITMPVTQRRWTADNIRFITREDHARPRYEVIDGELLVTTSFSIGHQLAAQELLYRLGVYLKQTRVGTVLMSPSELELRPDNIVQPDVFVVPRNTPIAGEMREWSDVKSLLLAVEVLSPETMRNDRVVKRDFYLDNGVEEYWIVDLDGDVFECWRPSQETPLLYREEIIWAPRGRDPLVIDLAAYFDEVHDKGRRFGR